MYFNFAFSWGRSCSEARWVAMNAMFFPKLHHSQTFLSFLFPSSLTSVCASFPLGRRKTCRFGGGLPLSFIGELSKWTVRSPPDASSRSHKESLHDLSGMHSNSSFCADIESLNCGTTALRGET